MGGESEGGGFRVRYAAEDPTLPPPWRALVDDRTGYLYFWNPKTNVTQYTKPTADDALPNPNRKSLEEEEEEEATHQLEKPSPEMRAEIAEVNFTSVHKLGGVHSLEASIGDKSQEVEKEFFSLDAKLSEPHSKSSEVDRKLEEEGTFERKHQQEVLSSNTEWRTSEMDAEQRAHVLDLGEMPQNGQKRLVDRLSVEGEVRENETDGVRKQEREFEVETRMIQVTSNSLENKEVDLNIRLRALTLKEKDADIKMMNLENKEKYLCSKEENLNVRERDLQKLVDHNAILSAKMQEFELEMEKKRESFEEEMKNKRDALDEREKEINQKEEHISKREQELESKMNRLKINKMEIGTKSKALESGEESLNNVDKKLEEEKKQLPKGSQELAVSMAELESLEAATEEQQQVTCIMENVKPTEDERGVNLKLLELQSMIKHEIEHMKRSFVKETEALIEKREQFEREWEPLGEKRIAVETEVKKLDAERERFEKWLCNEKEKLKRVCLQAETDIQRELVDLRLKSGAFENILERERSVAHEFTMRELTDVAQEIDLHKHVLEMNMQRMVEDMVKKLQEREKELAGVAAQEHELHQHALEMNMKKKLDDMEKKFQEKVIELNMRRETKLNNISSSIKLNDFRIRELSEQRRLEEPYTCKKKRDTHQAGGKDTNTLYVLSRNVKDRHAEFIQEREQFLASAEPRKTCHNFGVGLSGSEVLGLQSSTETENTNVRLRCLAEGCLEDHREGEQTIQSPPGTSSQSVGSAGNTSLSRKYSRHFNFTSGQIVQHSTQDSGGKPIQFGDSLDMAASEDLTGSGVTHNHSDIRRGQADGNARSSKELESLDKAGEPSIRVEDTSIDIIMVTDRHSRPAEGETVIASADEQVETVGSSLPLENHSQPQSSKQQQVQSSSRLGAITASRTRPVKAATEDANDILGEISDLRDEEQPDGDAQESQGIDQQSQGGSLGRSRKRKQASTTCGDRRYNLRRCTTRNISVASEQAKDLKTPIDEIVKGDHVGDGTATDEAAISPLTG